jgi:Zinc finger C-x8-C-x5-C-x3-H type (and similar)
MKSTHYNYLVPIKTLSMLRRNMQYLTHNNDTPLKNHKKSPSNSTDESADESVEMRIGKEKSQLCKRFMENGYCPY